MAPLTTWGESVRLHVAISALALNGAGVGFLNFSAQFKFCSNIVFNHAVWIKA